MLASYAACSLPDHTTLAGNATNVTLTGLRAQRSYVVILTARNAVGASAPTVISSLVTSTAVPPSPPVAVSVVSTTRVARLHTGHRVARLEQGARSPVHCSVAL